MTLIETIILNNNIIRTASVLVIISPQLLGGGLFSGDFPFPFDARSGIRTHEANATDLKSVPFDRSGIRANVLIN